MLTLPETLTKFEKVIYGCNDIQLNFAKKWCKVYIEKYYYYPNDNFELLLNFVDWCVKLQKETNKN